MGHTVCHLWCQQSVTALEWRSTKLQSPPHWKWINVPFQQTLLVLCLQPVQWDSNGHTMIWISDLSSERQQQIQHIPSNLVLMSIFHIWVQYVFKLWFLMSWLLLNHLMFLYIFSLTCFINPWHYSMTLNKWNADNCCTVDKEEEMYKVLDHPNPQKTENTHTKKRQMWLCFANEKCTIMRYLRKMQVIKCKSG